MLKHICGQWEHKMDSEKIKLLIASVASGTEKKERGWSLVFLFCFRGIFSFPILFYIDSTRSYKFCELFQICSLSKYV